MNERDRDPRSEDPVQRAEHEATGVEPEADPPLSQQGARNGGGRDGSDVADGSERPIDAPQTELEILRGELAALQQRVAAAEQAVSEQEARALRARAELDTVRRRAAADEDRARDAGLDTAVLPVMAVYDDLRRALSAAESGDPASIVPGVRAVMEGLERNLAKIDIARVGEVGEPFDPGLHEALTAVPLGDGVEPGTIAEVYEVGFRRGDRLIRPARVVVYQDREG